MLTAMLYWAPVRLRSVSMPSIFALPMFALSIYATRYKKANSGKSLMSNYKTVSTVSFRLCCLSQSYLSNDLLSSLLWEVCEEVVVILTQAKRIGLGHEAFTMLRDLRLLLLI